MSGMDVTRVELYAPVSSFRHPFFVTGHQPCFNFPPPSTIYGLCACALGIWPDPQSFFFGAFFTYRSSSQDLEHQHITIGLGSKTTKKIATSNGSIKATNEITIQPVLRGFLFDVHLTLYLPRYIGTSFNSPVNTITIGRSQDLAEVLSVKDISLHRPDRARIEHTILPGNLMLYINRGTIVLLSRFIDETPDRDVKFDKYLVLHDPILYDKKNTESTSMFNPPEDVPLESFWSDPDFCDEEGYARAIWIHEIKES